MNDEIYRLRNQMQEYEEIKKERDMLRRGPPI